MEFTTKSLKVAKPKYQFGHLQEFWDILIKPEIYVLHVLALHISYVSNTILTIFENFLFPTLNEIACLSKMTCFAKLIIACESFAV